MANSGIEWIDVTFDFCVRFLFEVAALLGITYEEINVWLFVIMLPVILVISIGFNIYHFIYSNRTATKTDTHSGLC